MANAWFRMYAEFSTDSKVQMMPEDMQRRLVMLFCMRCSDVTVTLSDAEIAFHLRISEEELAKTKALFLSKKFIDKSWNILNWDKRQFASDSSAARTRAYRDRKRNASVTSHATQGDALDTDTDTEKSKGAKAPSPSAEPSGGAPVAASTAERLSQVTAEAIAAFNASPLVKPNGGSLPTVNPDVGRAKRQAQVKRCLRVAREICKAATGSTLVTPEFWQGYFGAAAEDDFYAGRRAGGPGHEGYVPDFELLTREATMLRIFDRTEAAA